ncbi:MAG: bifunctional nicotinamidase/pyrazinamidase [Candidatus Helarchaeota archaeon]|nr:bifunctional nicotinamidase/pyrazinamidase [Candidatus Helarchaeota archaeon]
MKISDLKLEAEVSTSKTDCLLIVDVQNDFVPGGNLPVEQGNEIIDGINEVAVAFKKKNGLIVLTQDWHPPNHKSFASAHSGKNPFDEYTANGIGPVLWPDHCVQGEKGADFHPALNINLADKIIQKGINPEIDSYSGFLENDKKTETGLANYLKSVGVTRVFVCGLALDYCVYFTAIDGKTLGFDVWFIIDLTRGIDAPEGNISNALETMAKNGIKFVKAKTLLTQK